MNRIIFASAIALLAAGCATAPEKIVAIHTMDPCSDRDRARLNVLYKEQKQARTADTVGVILIGVPVASLAGKDRETEIAVLKGRCN